MNELVERLNKNDIPVLLKYNDMLKIGFEEKEVNILLNESLEKEWIDNVYKDIYTLGYKYKKALVSEGVLAQLIDPDSYVSLLYILSDLGWIPDAVYNIISITNNTNMIVWTNKFGGYKYNKLYKSVPSAGIFREEYGLESYRRATPLRALCDYIYLFNYNWENIDCLEDYLRIKKDSLEELKAKDFDELHDNFKIKNIENFLVGIRKELGL